MLISSGKIDNIRYEVVLELNNIGNRNTSSDNLFESKNRKPQIDDMKVKIKVMSEVDGEHYIIKLNFKSEFSNKYSILGYDVPKVEGCLDKAIKTIKQFQPKD